VRGETVKRATSLFLFDNYFDVSLTAIRLIMKRPIL